MNRAQPPDTKNILQNLIYNMSVNRVSCGIEVAADFVRDRGFHFAYKCLNFIDCRFLFR